MTREIIHPTLAYRDVPGAIGFLVEAFGFVEARTFRGDGDVVHHAELVWPAGGRLMLHTAGAEDNAIADVAVGPGGLPVGIQLDVSDPDALFERAVAAGARVVRAPTDSPHSTRDCMLADPEGLVWSFGTPLPDPIPGIAESPKFTS